MTKVTNEQIINSLKAGAIPALGCTEPVACALAAARAKEELGAVPDKIEVKVSGNIFKNGMGVGIPGTGTCGLYIASALGAVCGKTEYGLEALKDVALGDNLKVAKKMVDDKKIKISIKEDADDKLYVETICSLGKDVVRVIIKKAHTNIIFVEKNGKTVYQKDSGSLGEQNSSEDCVEMNYTVERIWNFVNKVDIRDIRFLLDGVKMNKHISDAGLTGNYGLKIGYTIKKNIETGILSDDLLTQTLMITSAASDARMDGFESPVMTNSGSGNQGITVYLPVYSASLFFKTDEEKLIRALALSNLIAEHVHSFMGHLSALCGINIAAMGAACGITYIMGGDLSKINNTIKTMASNLTGMMCDGAKLGCSLKVYSGVSAAVQAALLSMNNVATHNDGIIDVCIEKTIKNIGIIASEGMDMTDKTILKIMTNKIC